MVNHIGKTNKTLSTTLGETVTFSDSEEVSLIAGELSLGLLMFDSVGTVGVISSFTSNNDFVVTTVALSLDIPTILSLEY